MRHSCSTGASRVHHAHNQISRPAGLTCAAHVEHCGSSLYAHCVHSICCLQDFLVYHSWNPEHTFRACCVTPIIWQKDGTPAAEATWGSDLPLPFS